MLHLTMHPYYDLQVGMFLQHAVYLVIVLVDAFYNELPKLRIMILIALNVWEIRWFSAAHDAKNIYDA